MRTPTVSVTILTDFEVPSTRHCATAAHAFGLGDNALINLSCDRYIVRFVNGAQAIGRRRVYEAGKYRLGDYYSVTDIQRMPS